MKKLEQLASQGDPDAQYKLGNVYAQGKGVEQSDEQAVYWYKKAAEQGHASAQYNLGVSFKNGEGVDQCYIKSALWFSKGAEQGETASQCYLGLSYLLGRGIEQSDELGLTWLNKSAEKGNPQAQLCLGMYYLDNKVSDSCCETGVMWLTKAAEQDVSEAQLRLSYCYMQGKGVELSGGKVIYWSEKAAELGNAEAQFFLGIQYASGNFVDKSDDKAAYWCTKASEQGYPKAHYYLGLYYKESDRSHFDNEKSEMYFRRAFEAGEYEAQRYLPHPVLDEHIYPKLDYEKAKLARAAFYALQAEIVKIMDEQKVESGVVYHFTRWSAIESMLPKDLKDREKPKNVLRLYHEDYMNDPNEGKSFINLLRNRSKISVSSKFMMEVLNLHSELSTDEATYITSFTKSRDRLDLWRAYGSDGYGFCLTVSCPEKTQHQWAMNKLETSMDREFDGNKHSFYNVIYDDDRKNKLLNNLLLKLDDIIDLFKNDFDVLNEVRKAVFYIIGEVVYLFKDEQYSSEREVRVFRRLSIDQVSLDETEFGKLYAITAPILFNGVASEIMIGPKVPNKRVVELSLRKRLQLHGFSNTMVTYSKVEYR
ncbi:DUF2971 domain-containing protein [Enterovibrio norvegicus]|uniref:DUF2971 domain-containing protein n=1 Tax=Enterovibrio norvegicus TaxID=188144 RepID=A0A2N7L8C6_9GAMM|nr:DUF2971 domain-containing protein [Enterovibrio norvegicus]PMN90427.1 hypothetical protein BCT23_19935 [Enterovibrio norvegicus]